MQLAQSIHCIQINNENTYIIIDNQIILIDAINDKQWFNQIDYLLDNRSVDVFIMSHEYQIDTILSLCQKYPHMQLMGTLDLLHHLNLKHLQNPISCIVDMIHLNHHTLYFLSSHKYIVTYIIEDKMLLSSSFFSLQYLFPSWIDNARYYYVKNLGYSQTYVSNIIKSFDIEMICPSYGQIIHQDIKQYIRYLQLWEQCIPEEDGVFIVTDSSNYNLYQVSQSLQNDLIQLGDDACLYDIVYSDLIFLVSQFFKYDRIIICVELNHLDELLEKLRYMHIQNRVIGFVCIDYDQYFILKYQLSFLNNILYIDPLILDKKDISIHQYAKLMMEVGCVDGVCG